MSEVILSIVYSIFPFCKGDSCCGTCNPRCCRSCCTCGFNEDDNRFNHHDQGANGAGGQAPAVPTPNGGVGTAGRGSAEYARNEMKAPGTV